MPGGVRFGREGVGPAGTVPHSAVNLQLLQVFCLAKAAPDRFLLRSPTKSVVPRQYIAFFFAACTQHATALAKHAGCATVTQACWPSHARPGHACRLVAQPSHAACCTPHRWAAQATAVEPAGSGGSASGPVSCSLASAFAAATEPAARGTWATAHPKPAATARWTAAATTTAATTTAAATTAATAAGTCSGNDGTCSAVEQSRRSMDSQPWPTDAAGQGPGGLRGWS